MPEKRQIQGGDDNLFIFASPVTFVASNRSTNLVPTGISVTISTHRQLVQNVGYDFENVGAVGLDAIFCPYTTQSAHPKLPHWEVPNSGAESPTNRDLNIFFPTMSSAGNPTVYAASGSNISTFNSFSGVGSGTSGDLNPYAQIYESNTVGSAARAVGLRSPIILTGYGFDINGSPVPPHPTDNTKFHPDAFRNPSLWKSGPVDLRWDDDRKVWAATGEPSNTIRFQIVESDCEEGSAIVRILSRPKKGKAVPEEYEISGQTELNEEGQTVQSKFTVVYDKMGCFLNESNVNLVGRRGMATYLYGSPIKSYQPWTAWEITALAEQQSECESV